MSEMAGLHSRGRETFAALVEGGDKRLDAIFRGAPALGEQAVGLVYGHLAHRPALDPRTREAVAIAAIVASGCWETPLTVHVTTALAAGLCPAEIAEVVLETSAFAGMPRAVTAATRLPELFEKAGHVVPPIPAPREVLLAFVADLPRDDVTVVGTGPDTAVAVFTTDGVATSVIHARTADGRVVGHTVLTP